jgi:hypothetical protein
MRSPIEGENILGFIAEVLSSCNFNWYVKLGFVPSRHRGVSESTNLWESVWEATDPGRRGGWTRTPVTAWDCLEQWLNEIQIGPGFYGPGVRDYVWLEECQGEGRVVFHVLIANWSGFSDAWEVRWKEISNGWAKTREVDDRTGGLLGYLVMRVGCVLEVNCGGVPGRYSARDFRPWNPKTY